LLSSATADAVRASLYLINLYQASLVQPFSGKTSLLSVFAWEKSPVMFIPSIFGTYVANVQVDGRRVALAPDSHVTLLCYSIDCPDSLKNVTEMV